MSRIGKLGIKVPAGVTISEKDNIIIVKGPKGELTQEYDSNAVSFKVEDGECTVECLNESKDAHAKHGLYRALIHNMVVGVSEGYKKTLELVGVGYRATSTGQVLELSLGYTHNIVIGLAPEITVSTVSERNKNPMIILESCDKQLLGQVCAKIRSYRMPEPYKGKGVKFQGEVIRRKAGKTASK